MNPTIIILLVAVGVAVADVSELVNRYLPPPLFKGSILDDFSVTEAPAHQPEPTTASAATTVVEIEQVPLDEMHYEEQQPQVQTTVLPVPSIYEQPPVLVYEAPVAPTTTEEAPTTTEEAAPTTTEEAPTTTEAPAPVEVAPIVEEIIVIEETSIAPTTEKAIMVEEASEVAVVAEVEVSSEAPAAEVKIAAEVAQETCKGKGSCGAEEVVLVKESFEVPVVEPEPEPAHELAEDGYRYKSGSSFRFRRHMRA